MELLMSVVVGVFFMVGTYLLMTRSLIRVVIGINLLSHATHLLLLTMAGLKTGAPPLLNRGETEFSDPLPQALILTAIVISFGITAFTLVLAYRTYKVNKTDDLDQLRGSHDE
ncbi:multicomponent Na+:H+ antiporter subunit C [Geomicrobium halophilum]|uniref:Multicomponent Na+:H+ antiporter subunit C n=1 Tax=Geomicrobium halophilum TaxID=549000 RepID=A0A841PIU2_9BACL|nr:Na(+)/H(+) antiporter subunit C [Geomicrobium halophilum]MBB6448797.1 multicomponent Na+:H+ antiporter subunit C [Geomicrobium halophilum]